MDELENVNAKGKKPDWKAAQHMIPLLRDVQKRHIYRDRKQTSAGQRPGGEGVEVTDKGYELPFLDAANILEVDNGDSCVL